LTSESIPLPIGISTPSGRTYLPCGSGPVIPQPKHNQTHLLNYCKLELRRSDGDIEEYRQNRSNDSYQNYHNLEPESPSLSLPLRFNGHFPDGPGLDGTRRFSFWILLELRMMEVVSSNNWSYKTRKAPVKSSPPTNQHSVFFTDWMSFLSPNQQCPKGNYNYYYYYIDD